MISAKSIRHRIHPEELNKIRVCLLLILLAAVSANAKYSIECYDIYGKYHFKSEYVARPAISFGIDYLQERKQEKVVIRRPKQTGYFSGNFSRESLQHLRNWGLLPANPDSGYPVMKKPFTKILLIVLESMDLANIHAYNPGIPENTTPFLDQLSRDYLSFSHYYTASQPTSWGLNSMILSRIEYEADLMLKNTSIFDLLQKQGYQGYYLSPMNGMFADNRRIYEEQFRPQHIFFLEELNQMFGITGGKTWGITDNNMYYCTRQILQKIPEDQKYFVMLSTIDTHPPYTESGSLENQTGLHTPFLRSLRCADRNLQEFLEPLMQSEQFDEQMLIIVTADHSATHGENYLQREEFSPDRIPLILITRNNWLASAYPFDPDKLCSQIDLPVTLLNLLGIDAPETFMGRNMITKKSFAYTKSPQYLLLHLPGNRQISWILAQPAESASPEEKAVYDFYDLYYGIEELPRDSETYNLF